MTLPVRALSLGSDFAGPGLLEREATVAERPCLLPGVAFFARGLVLARYSKRDQKRWIQKRYHTYAVIYLVPLYCDPGSLAEIPIDVFMVVAAISQGDLDFSDDRRVSVIGD
jgi:hypothetical protein